VLPFVLGCPEGTGAFAKGGGAKELLLPAQGATANATPNTGTPQPYGGMPSGHPPITGQESSKELLAKIDAMKEELKARPRTLEIRVALGNLYYDNGRYLDAVDSYREAMEVAQPAWKKLESLPAAARKETLPEPVRRACTRGPERDFEALSQAAEAHTGKGELAAAGHCWRQALLPALAAQARRGNAFFLVGNPTQAMAEHEQVLSREPDYPESLFYLGAILFDTAGEDVEKFKRARVLWQRLQQVDPKSPNMQVVKENLPRIEAAIKAGGKMPAEPAKPPQPGEVSPGAAEAIAGADVKAPGFMQAAERQIAEGEALMDKEEWQAARERIKGFLPIFMTKAPDSPLFPRVLTDMGMIYISMGNKEMGPRLLKMALERDPNNALAKEALAAFEKGKPMPKTGVKKASPGGGAP
jgi:tetratricopeptide (TPR) repeat protein